MQRRKRSARKEVEARSEEVIRTAVERTADHRYFLTDRNGRREALGVTRTLIESNLIDDEYFTDRARGRGKLAHYVAERIVTNTLAQPVDSSVVGYMVAIRKFLDMYAPTVHGAEVVLAHVFRLLAGTVDLDVSILGGPAVIDIKTSNPSAWHGLQLAPYAFLLDGTKWLSRARFGLYLRETGGFRLKEYDNHTDLDTFFRAHELLHWRCTHGSFERPYGRRSIDPVVGVAVAGSGSTHVDDNDGDRPNGLYGDPPDSPF